MPEEFVQVVGQLLPVAFFVALANERLVEVFVAVWFKRYGLDGWWLVPISWVTGGLLMFGTGINLFEWLFPVKWVGVLLSAVVVGGGSNMLHQVFTVTTAIKELVGRRE